ncbi:MAG: hypothetical protein V3U75_05540 [Methylococcaceae bacterium]
MRELSSIEITMVSGAGESSLAEIAAAFGKSTPHRGNIVSIREVIGRLPRISRRLRRELGLPH